MSMSFILVTLFAGLDAHDFPAGGPLKQREIVFPGPTCVEISTRQALIDGYTYRVRVNRAAEVRDMAGAVKRSPAAKAAEQNLLCVAAGNGQEDEAKKLLGLQF
jgi:hypothetical protein